MCGLFFMKIILNNCRLNTIQQFQNNLNLKVFWDLIFWDVGHLKFRLENIPSYRQCFCRKCQIILAFDGNLEILQEHSFLNDWINFLRFWEILLFYSWYLKSQCLLFFHLFFCPTHEGVYFLITPFISVLKKWSVLSLRKNTSYKSLRFRFFFFTFLFILFFCRGGKLCRFQDLL